MKLSIITPVFNGVDLIADCVAHVSAQGVKDCEHIVVDGGSTDGTVEVLQRIAPEHPNLRWLSEKDEGQSDAMNKGWKMAKGAVIGYLNCDDFYEQGTLAYISKLFQDYPHPSFCVGHCKVLKENDELLYVNKPRRLNFFDLLSGDEAFAPFPVNPAAYFYHRSLHELVGGYDVKEHYAMDLDFILRAVRVAHVFSLDQVLGSFRLVPGTKTHSDIQSGSAPGRFDALLDRHRAQLTAAERMQYGWRKCVRRLRAVSR